MRNASFCSFFSFFFFLASTTSFHICISPVGIKYGFRGTGAGCCQKEKRVSFGVRSCITESLTMITGDMKFGVRALVLGENWHLVVINSTEKVRQVETQEPLFPCLCGVTQESTVSPSLLVGLRKSSNEGWGVSHMWSSDREDNQVSGEDWLIYQSYMCFVTPFCPLPWLFRGADVVHVKPAPVPSEVNGKIPLTSVSTGLHPQL